MTSFVHQDFRKTRVLLGQDGSGDYHQLAWVVCTLLSDVKFLRVNLILAGNWKNLEARMPEHRPQWGLEP